MFDDIFKEDEDGFKFIPKINQHIELPKVNPELLKNSSSLDTFIEEAKEQGRQEERMLVAQKMLKDKIGECAIAKYSGLCLSSVEKLKEKLGLQKKPSQ